MSRWCARHKVREFRSHQQQERHRKQRRLNPAYHAKLKRADVERSVETLSVDKDLYLSDLNDRPLRDLSGLQFFGHLRKLTIGKGEITDLSPLRFVRDLEELNLRDEVIEDLRPVGALTKLRQFSISIHQPWPVVDGWSALQNLEYWHWHGNLLVLA